VTERVTFSSDGLRLTGDLRRGDRPWAIVLTGPFTGVKEQVTGRYAEQLTAEGFTTLAFDHRGFGASEGRPRHEDPAGKLADLRAAVEELDGYRVAAVGVCLGGGYAMKAAATDPRIEAVAGVAGAYNSPAWFAERMGLDAYRGALRDMLRRYDDYLPAVAPDGGEAAMPGAEPWEYYGPYAAGGSSWRNEVTRGSLHGLMTLDVLGGRPLLPPSLIVHGRRDDYCSPDLARAMAADETVWLESDRHIDFYDTDEYVTAAVTAVTGFLSRLP
jgi:pimeloyl-ACP methyl ester carboxylesterase